jgi:hypothetical protein
MKDLDRRLSLYVFIRIVIWSGTYASGLVKAILTEGSDLVVLAGQLPANERHRDDTDGVDLVIEVIQPEIGVTDLPGSVR